MDRKQIGMDRRCQSAVMYVVMAFFFCLFLWIFAAAKAPLPGPFSPEQGVPIHYSIELKDYGVNGNSVMFRGVHEYVRIYLDGEKIDETE